MAIRDFGFPPHEPGRPHLVPCTKLPRWRKVVVVGVDLPLCPASRGGDRHLCVAAQWVVPQLRTERSCRRKPATRLNTPVHCRISLHPLARHGGFIRTDGAGCRRCRRTQMCRLPPTVAPGASACISACRSAICCIARLSPLTDITIDSPWSSLRRCGRATNLPTLQPSNSSSQYECVRPGDPAHGHRPRRSVRQRSQEPLDADLHDLAFQFELRHQRWRPLLRGRCPTATGTSSTAPTSRYRTICRPTSTPVAPA